MTRTTLTMLTACAMSTAALGDEPVSQQQLISELQSLRAEVAELRARSDASVSTSSPTTAPATLAPDPVAAAIAAVQTDARARTPYDLQTSGAWMAGWQKGKFLIQSEDGSFSLQPLFQFQFRSITNIAQDARNGGADDDVQSGFEIRRAKFGFAGSAFTKNLQYLLVLAVDRATGNVYPEDLWARYMFTGEEFGGVEALKSFGFRVGQFKDPAVHEALVGSKRHLAVDASLLNQELGEGVTDYVQGVSLLYAGNAMRGELAFTDGTNSDNTNYTDGGGTARFHGVPNADYGVHARVELALMNLDEPAKGATAWKQYDDFTAQGNTADMLMIGGGASFTGDGDNFLLIYTADAQFENRAGTSLYLAGIGHHRHVVNSLTTARSGTNPQPPLALDVAGGNFNDFGGMVQVGQMLSDKLEVFGRYSLVIFDDASFADDRGNTLDIALDNRVQEITAGINYYFSGQSAKLTIDVGYLPDGAFRTQSGIGVRGGSNYQEAQFYVRGQFQLLL